MNTPYVGAVLELSVMLIEEKIAKKVMALTREICCDGNCCSRDELCGVARHEYRMLWVKEWREYAKTN